jgi:hypothetical protein
MLRWVAGVVSCELHTDAGKLGGLTCATQRVGLAKMDQVILSSTSRDLKRRPDWARRDPFTRMPLGPNCLQGISQQAFPARQTTAPRALSGSAGGRMQE